MIRTRHVSHYHLCHSSASPTCVSWTRTVSLSMVLMSAIDVFLMRAHPVLRSCALPLCNSDLCCFEPAITLDDVQRSTNCVNWNLFFFLLTEIWTNVLWHRNPAQYQLCQSDRGDDGRNNSGIHIQLHKCVLQLKKKSLRAWDLSHRSPAHYQLCQPDCGDDGRNNSDIHVQLHKCVLQ